MNFTNTGTAALPSRPGMHGRLSAADAGHCPTETRSAVARARIDPAQLSKAIDVVAALAEQAERAAARGAQELAMAKALGATFGYMVAYCKRLAIDQDGPDEALAKAAAGTTELTAAQLAVLRACASEL